MLKPKDAGKKLSTETVEEATNLINSINGKLMLKKMTNRLNNFESNVVKSLPKLMLINLISIIASLPSVSIDKNVSRLLTLPKQT